MIEKFVFVSVVFNDFKNTYELCQSIESIKFEKKLIECILVDNSDSKLVQSLIDKLSDSFSFVKILRPKKNLGYFGAFNFFFESSFFDRSFVQVVVLCNNDLIFSENFLDRFSRSSYPNDVYVVCPDVLTVEGVHQNPHVLQPRSSLVRLKLDFYFTHYYLACVLNILKRFGQNICGRKRRMTQPAPGYLHMGIGACYVLMPFFVSRLRLLEYPHFLYGEEAYFTKQVHSSGGKLYYDPNLEVLHKESATLSKLPKRITYEFAREGYWLYRNFY